MRRTPSAVIAAALAAAGIGSVLRAQQTVGTPTAESQPAVNQRAVRGARYLLRNGLDYLNYPAESARALAFLREAEAQQVELTEAERQELRRAIARAEAESGRGRGGETVPAALPAPRVPAPGSIVAAARARAPGPEPEPVVRTSGTVVEGAGARVFPAAAAPGLTPPGLADAGGLPPLPAEPGAGPAPPPPPPALSGTPAASIPAPRPEPEPALLPALPPEPVSRPAGGPGGSAVATAPAAPPEMPAVAPPPLTREAPAVEPPPAPAAEELTARPPAGAPVPVPVLVPAPAPAVRVDAAPAEIPPDSSLTPDLRREVEQMAERQDRELRQFGPGGPPSDATGEEGSTTSRLELPRAPSPTEARPIRPIQVPEEFVPMAPRVWSPSRKYWAAPATCHGPLYFQDAALERYGQSVEQAFGPVGRYLSYPIDDPTQSDQRNQILQPFVSIGKFASQIVLLPYNLVVDPPGEAEYDLGYYRPGDRIPTDTHYFPIWGVGPPLRGKHY